MPDVFAGDAIDFARRNMEAKSEEELSRIRTEIDNRIRDLKRFEERVRKYGSSAQDLQRHIIELEEKVKKLESQQRSAAAEDQERKRDARKRLEEKFEAALKERLTQIQSRFDKSDKQRKSEIEKLKAEIRKQQNIIRQSYLLRGKK